MKKIALSLLSAAVLTGCVEARHVQDPQGKDYLHVECTSLNSYKPVSAKCQQRLTKECPGGYTLVGAAPVFAMNGITLVAQCDRDANNAQRNVSSFAAFAKISHVAETDAGLFATEKSKTQPANTALPDNSQYHRNIPVNTIEETTVTSDKNGKKEVTTTRRQIKTSRNQAKKN